MVPWAVFSGEVATIVAAEVKDAFYRDQFSTNMCLPIGVVSLFDMFLVTRGGSRT